MRGQFGSKSVEILVNNLGENFLLAMEFAVANCTYELDEVTTGRLISVLGLGTLICLFGVISNLLILITLAFEPTRSANKLFLSALAVFDILVLVTYMSLHSVEALYSYLDDSYLHSFWASEIRIVFPLSRCSQTCGIYLTVLVAFERFLAIVYPRCAQKSFTWAKAYLYIAIVVLLCFCATVSRFWEITVVANPNCTGIASAEVLPSELLKNADYRMIYSVWFTSILNVFLPFAVLLVLAVTIIQEYRKTFGKTQHQPVAVRDFQTFQRRERLRDTTKVLIVLVLMYLTTNALGLVIGVIEAIDDSILKQQQQAYRLGVDLINVLAIFNCSVRFVNYYVFNRSFRSCLKELLGLGREVRFEYLWRQHMAEFIANQSRFVAGLPANTVVTNGGRVAISNGKTVELDLSSSSSESS